MLVGLGSIAFHASLKCMRALALSNAARPITHCLPDPMQLWDELSMIYTTCLMMFASFSYSRSVVFSSVFGLCLLGLSAFISVGANWTVITPCSLLMTIEFRYIIILPKTQSSIRWFTVYSLLLSCFMACG